MAGIPYGSIELDRDKALHYHHGWTEQDRQLARDAIAQTGVIDFYVPPSGGYVAGHGGGQFSYDVNYAVNGLYMHVGKLILFPNLWDEREEWELSQHRNAYRSVTGARTPDDEVNALCTRCFLYHAGDCG